MGHSFSVIRWALMVVVAFLLEACGGIASDMGTDAGPVVDSGSAVADSGSAMADSGSVAVDAGSTGADSGSAMADSGSVAVDAGSTGADSGSVVMDAGSVADAGSSVVLDSGVAPTGVQLLLQGQDVAGSTDSNTPTKPNHILIGWKSVAGASSYTIYRAAHPGASTPPYAYTVTGSVTAAIAANTYTAYLSASKTHGVTSQYGGKPYQTNVDSAYQDTNATNCVGSEKGSPNASNRGEYFNTLGTPGGYDPIGYTYKVTAIVNGVESAQSDDSIMIYFADGNRIMNADIYNGPIDYADTKVPVASPLGYRTNAYFEGPYINPYSGNGSAVANLNLKGFNTLVISLYTDSSDVSPIGIAELSGDQPVLGSTPYSNGFLLAPFTPSGVTSPENWTLPKGRWTTFRIPISSYYVDTLDSAYPNTQQYSFYKITLGTAHPVWVEWYWSVN